MNLWGGDGLYPININHRTSEFCFLVSLVTSKHLNTADLKRALFCPSAFVYRWQIEILRCEMIYLKLHVYTQNRKQKSGTESDPVSLLTVSQSLSCFQEVGLLVQRNRKPGEGR